jgi:hypothetical protein
MTSAKREAEKQATQRWKRTQREDGRAEGGVWYSWSSRKRRGPGAYAVPDQAATKPGGCNTATEIINKNKIQKWPNIPIPMWNNCSPHQ